MSLYKRCLGLALLLCLSPACISSTENDPEDWDIKENNDNNKNNQPGYSPVTLRLLTGDTPAFYEPFFGPAVISVTDENGAFISLGAPYCNCSTECPVGAAPAPMPQYIVPNDKIEQLWDGSYWVPKANEQNCTEKQFKPKGAKFFANFCTAPHYLTSEMGSVFGEGDKSLIECQKVPFTLGEDTTVEKVVEWPRKDLDLEIVFENPAVSPTNIYVKNQCSGGSAAWFNVTQKLWPFDVQTILPGQSCTGMQCGETQQSFCQSVDFAPCEAYLTVEPGQSIKYQWDGWATVNYNNGQCSLFQPAARGPATIEVCYRPGLMGQPAGDNLERCDSMPIQIAPGTSPLVFRPARNP